MVTRIDPMPRGRMTRVPPTLHHTRRPPPCRLANAQPIPFALHPPRRHRGRFGCRRARGREGETDDGPAFLDAAFGRPEETEGEDGGGEGEVEDDEEVGEVLRRRGDDFESVEEEDGGVGELGIAASVVAAGREEGGARD